MNPMKKLLPALLALDLLTGAARIPCRGSI